MLLGVLPGVFVFLVIVVGGKLVMFREQDTVTQLTLQVAALPQINERPDAVTIINSAVSAVNAAIVQRNLGVDSVNLLGRVASRLPSDVRFVSYSPSTSSLELEAPSQDTLGTATSLLVSSNTLNVTSPTNELGSKTIYPTATLAWSIATPTPAPVEPSPSPSGSPEATQ